MKHIVKAFLLVILALSVSGCAGFTFDCVKSVGFTANPDSNPACMTGLCDEKETVKMRGPGPGYFKHLCDEGKMHWWKNQDELACIPDPCIPGKMIFNPDGSMACGNFK